MATYAVVEDRPYLDGFVSVLKPENARKDCAFYMGTTAKGRTSPKVISERDARRWIDEHQIGGNPAVFLHELQNRRRWR